MAGNVGVSNSPKPHIPTVSKELSNLVLDQLWAQLGKPSDLHLAKVKEVGRLKFRVDVYRDLKNDTFLGTATRITDSFYLITDDNGVIQKRLVGDKIVPIDRKY